MNAFEYDGIKFLMKSVGLSLSKVSEIYNGYTIFGNVLCKKKMNAMTPEIGWILVSFEPPLMEYCM